MQKVLVLFVFLAFDLTAQSDKLKEIILERKTLYTAWKERLDQKSGFFGNQTKADLEEINNVLKQIIKKDNEILDELENAQKEQFQSLQEKYNTISNDYDKLIETNKGLAKKLEDEKIYLKNNHSQIQRIEGDRILMGLLTVLFGSLFFWYFIKYKSARKKAVLLEKMIKDSLKKE